MNLVPLSQEPTGCSCVGLWFGYALSPGGACAGSLLLSRVVVGGADPQEVEPRGRSPGRGDGDTALLSEAGSFLWTVDVVRQLWPLGPLWLPLPPWDLLVHKCSGHETPPALRLSPEADALGLQSSRCSCTEISSSSQILELLGSVLSPTRVTPPRPFCRRGPFGEEVPPRFFIWGGCGFCPSSCRTVWLHREVVAGDSFLSLSTVNVSPQSFVASQCILMKNRLMVVLRLPCT